MAMFWEGMRMMR